ncbi:hypothetical protein EC973_004237 [Apophysomyces ossiformis]|uniref:C3H1-type domain-containing protein n=1 Tax=Apophysomyces ossiformis TaxID=679940 RepID=A0A8H7ERG7_9FUNG|nr:hypothetical protein EC973_004237 [Apophysomyces ossiformis]
MSTTFLEFQQKLQQQISAAISSESYVKEDASTSATTSNKANQTMSWESKRAPLDDARPLQPEISNDDGARSPRKRSPETPEELEQWLENRRRNYPRSQKQSLPEQKKRRADIDADEPLEPKKACLEATKEPGDETFFDATDEWSERKGSQPDTRIHLDRFSFIQNDHEHKEQISDERESGNGLVSQSRTLCIYFARGWCRRGNACHFAHELPQSDQLSRTTQVTEEALEQRPNLLYTVKAIKIRLSQE